MKYCVDTKNCINKKDLMDYGFCDESGNYIVKINKDKGFYIVSLTKHL